jgi:hypothetical protein
LKPVSPAAYFLVKRHKNALFFHFFSQGVKNGSGGQKPDLGPKAGLGAGETQKVRG